MRSRQNAGTIPGELKMFSFDFLRADCFALDEESAQKRLANNPRGGFC